MISIHPLHAERDDLPVGGKVGGKYFNPPSPCGEGQTADKRSVKITLISIHPLHAERDPDLRGGITYRLAFQSTLSMRRGTSLGFNDLNTTSISIHPLLAERDPREPCGIHPPTDFNPPSPCGEGPYDELASYMGVTHFNPPSPCGEGRRAKPEPTAWRHISIHPLLAERDT